ncbi:MAG: cupin domain-containing protein [Egibacteraceae bacterium]
MHRQPLTKIANYDVTASQRLGGEIRILLSPKTVGATDGFMGTIAIDPDRFVAEQYNPYSDKFCYVVHGSVTMRVDGIEVDVGPNEAIMVRRGQRHRIENRGVEQAFLVFHVCPLAPRPELGHVDTEELPNPDAALPQVGASR